MALFCFTLKLEAQGVCSHNKLNKDIALATLKVNRGTTYAIIYNHKVDGVATTLVGATVRFTMKSTEYDTDADDSDALVVKNVTSGTSGGVATITLTPTDTYQTPGKYFYDIKVDVASDGVTIYKMDEGIVKLGGSPTNRTS